MLNLKQLRDSRGMSQTDFAKEIGVAQNTVSNWENGNRILDAETASRIAEYFNVSVDYLLGRTEEPNVKSLDEQTEGTAMIRLKELRNAKKLSQKEIAEYLGITQQAYANYERQARQADYETLLKLSKYFNVSIDYLIGNTDIPGTPGEHLNDDELMFALWGDTTDVDESDLEDVRRYAAFIRERKNKK